MVSIEILRDYANGGFVIPAWEMIFYVGVMTFNALMGRTRSSLINSFAFTFYWGYMYLLPEAFSSNGVSGIALMTYVICGLGIYSLATLAFLRPAAQERALRANTGH